MKERGKVEKKAESRAITARIARWWEGRYVPPPKNDDDSGVFFLSIGTYERPALRRAFDFSVGWLRKNGNDIAVKTAVAVATATIGAIGWAIWRFLTN